ncbi:MAG: hypothetical protein WCQ49_02615 [Candidatus Saccharibacteria bacterium]
MSDSTYQDISLERAIKERFGIEADVRQSIVANVPVSPMADATLFLTSKKQLFLYISGKTKLTFGDVKKMVSSMGLKADTYLPPKGRPDYFNEIGRSKFCEVFPGRKNVNEDELIFYKTLAPYNPALVLISEVKDGHVYQFDSDSNTKWRPAARFAYRRIRTS